MVLSLLIIERMVLNTNLLGKDSPVQRKSGWKLGNQREDGLVMVLMFGEEGEGPRRGVRENYKHPLTGGLCPSSREVTRMFEVRASQTKLCLGRGRSTFIHIFFLWHWTAARWLQRVLMRLVEGVGLPLPSVQQAAKFWKHRLR